MDRKVTQSSGRTLAERVDCPFFAPFDQQIQRLTAGNPEFALLSSTAFSTLVLDKHLRLIDLRSFLIKNP
jgi:hypothetical protein